MPLEEIVTDVLSKEWPVPVSTTNPQIADESLRTTPALAGTRSRRVVIPLPDP